MSNHKARLARIETALTAPDADDAMRPRIELTHETRLARLHRLYTAAAQPEASPHLRRAAECYARMFLECNVSKWLAELNKLGPSEDPGEVERLCALAATRESDTTDTTELAARVMQLLEQRK